MGRLLRSSEGSSGGPDLRNCLAQWITTSCAVRGIYVVSKSADGTWQATRDAEIIGSSDGDGALLDFLLNRGRLSWNTLRDIRRNDYVGVVILLRRICLPRTFRLGRGGWGRLLRGGRLRTIPKSPPGSHATDPTMGRTRLDRGWCGLWGWRWEFGNCLGGVVISRRSTGRRVRVNCIT